MSDGQRPAFAVRQMRPGDLATAARLHHECLGDSFFASLGERYLAVYYDSFLSSPHGIALVVEDRGEMCGALVGTVDDTSHYRWVVRHCRRRLMVTAAVQMATRPRVIGRFVKTRARRYAKSMRLFGRAEPHSHRPVTGTLAHVAISSSKRRHGLGRLLVNAFVAEANERGAERLRLVTRADASGAASFYVKLGWAASGATTDLDGNSFFRFRLSLR